MAHINGTGLPLVGTIYVCIYMHVPVPTASRPIHPYVSALTCRWWNVLGSPIIKFNYTLEPRYAQNEPPRSSVVANPSRPSQHDTCISANYQAPFRASFFFTLHRKYTHSIPPHIGNSQRTYFSFLTGWTDAKQYPTFRTTRGHGQLRACIANGDYKSELENCVEYICPDAEYYNA